MHRGCIPFCGFARAGWRPGSRTSPAYTALLAAGQRQLGAGLQANQDAIAGVHSGLAQLAAAQQQQILARLPQSPQPPQPSAAVPQPALPAAAAARSAPGAARLQRDRPECVAGLGHGAYAFRAGPL
jgi:hypothetical protein